MKTKLEKTKEERFNIHVRAWGKGGIIRGTCFPIILLQESLWYGLLYLLLIPTIWAVWSNEKLPGGVEK